MSKSIKLKNNNFWDTKGIVHNKTLLSTILSTLLPAKYNTNWTTIHNVSYNDAYKPVFVIIRWGTNNTIGIYCIYANRVVEIVKNGNDTCTYSIDTTNKKVTFTLNNTGVLTYIECP